MCDVHIEWLFHSSWNFFIQVEHFSFKYLILYTFIDGSALVFVFPLIFSNLTYGNEDKIQIWGFISTVAFIIHMNYQLSKNNIFIFQKSS